MITSERATQKSTTCPRRSVLGLPNGILIYASEYPPETYTVRQVGIGLKIVGINMDAGPSEIETQARSAARRLIEHATEFLPANRHEPRSSLHRHHRGRPIWQCLATTVILPVKGKKEEEVAASAKILASACRTNFECRSGSLVTSRHRAFEPANDATQTSSATSPSYHGRLRLASARRSSR